MRKKPAQSDNSRKKILRVVLILSILLLLVFTLKSVQRLLVLTVFILLNFLLALGKRLLPLSGLKKYFFGI
ncbi:hypothetical protein JXC34_03580, partial [Candidatus Woesearchaeota archaeon]|nr:hypothetical protein [Candidatus Woesearchaeota archaeon]